MGLSSSKSKTTPVYGKQVEGAAANVTSAYNAQSPKISAISDQLGTLVPGLIEKYTKGDANINAAKGYNLDVLGGKYLSGNPHLDQMVATTGNNTRNGVTASLGTRGLTGGSAHADIVSRALAENEGKLRYADYDAERGRMTTAAGMAPSLAAAGELPLASIQAILEAQQMPVQTAAGAGNAVGGLLGQYTNTKQSGNLGQLIASIAGSAASAWASGGFK